jgi:hypothetical protein
MKAICRAMCCKKKVSHDKEKVEKKPVSGNSKREKID